MAPTLLSGGFAACSLGMLLAAGDKPFAGILFGDGVENLFGDGVENLFGGGVEILFGGGVEIFFGGGVEILSGGVGSLSSGGGEGGGVKMAGLVVRYGAQVDPGPRRAGLIERSLKEARSQVNTSSSTWSAELPGFSCFFSERLNATGPTFPGLRTHGEISKGVRGSHESQPMMQSAQLDIRSWKILVNTTLSSLILVAAAEGKLCAHLD